MVPSSFLCGILLRMKEKFKYWQFVFYLPIYLVFFFLAERNVRDVTIINIPFDDKSFDVVIISNALHIIPDPQKALSEISRVLKSDGVLIAPNFLGHRAGKKERFLAKILSLTGVVFELTWDETTYPKFLEQNGWNVKTKEVFKASFPLMYTECEKKS